jgi:hypothetical protein
VTPFRMIIFGPLPNVIRPPPGAHNRNSARLCEPWENHAVQNDLTEMRWENLLDKLKSYYTAPADPKITLGRNYPRDLPLSHFCSPFFFADAPASRRLV